MDRLRSAISMATIVVTVQTTVFIQKIFMPRNLIMQGLLGYGTSRVTLNIQVSGKLADAYSSASNVWKLPDRGRDAGHWFSKRTAGFGSSKVPHKNPTAVWNIVDGMNY